MRGRYVFLIWQCQDKGFDGETPLIITQTVVTLTIAFGAEYTRVFSASLD
jgi:hypothetical protein